MGRRLAGPIRPGPRTQGEPGFAYHATNEERACDIVERSSLRTHKPWEFTDQGSWPDGSTEKRSYHSARADNVWSFAPEEGPHVILRTPLPSHQFRSERHTGDLYTTRSISSEKIQIGLDEGWQPLKVWAKRNCGR